MLPSYIDLGGPGELDPSMWAFPPERFESTIWLLESCGFDSSASDIMSAIASMGPARLSEEAVSTLSEREQAEYRRADRLWYGDGVDQGF